MPKLSSYLTINLQQIIKSMLFYLIVLTLSFQNGNKILIIPCSAFGRRRHTEPAVVKSPI